MMPFPKSRVTNLTQTAFTQMMQARGYAQIGNGTRADVYANAPDSDRVVKVGRVNVDNYIHYVRAVGIRSKNPHFPQIYSVRVYDADPSNPLSEPYYVITMERLQHDIGDSCEFFDKFRRKPTTRHLRDVRRVIAQIKREYKAFTDYCASNVMWRGQTPVVTDPIV